MEYIINNINILYCSTCHSTWIELEIMIDKEKITNDYIIYCIICGGIGIKEDD
jgi:hypothetical protein